MSGVRAFVGIPLPDDVVDAFVDACAAVKVADPEWRAEKWVPRQNMHVTLKFLGDMAEDHLTPLADALARATALHQAFNLTDAGFRAVPNPRRARMLWGTFADPDGRCAALAAEIDRACLAFGVPPEERTFKPHVTLVRARRERHIQEAAIEAARDRLQRLPEMMSVPSTTLFSSRLTTREPIYAVLHTCRLGAA